MKLITSIACTAALLLGAAVQAQTASWPTRQVTIVAAYPPGGTVDILSRVIGQNLSEKWKQPVVVENRAGASGIVGSQFVQKQPADGYVLMVVPMTHATNSVMYKSVPYDPVKDFTPITMLAESPLVLVTGNAFPAKNVQELIGLTRANQGKYSCGSGGKGTSQHLACELFKSATKLDILHVPYKGNAQALTDVMGGQIEMQFDQIAASMPHIRGGRVRALAVTSAKRSPELPDVPTVAESGVAGFESTAWFGLVGPASMPPAVVQQINAAVHEALANPETRKKLVSLGLELKPSTPDHFRTTLEKEREKWSSVVKQAGISPD